MRLTLNSNPTHTAPVTLSSYRQPQEPKILIIVVYTPRFPLLLERQATWSQEDFRREVPEGKWSYKPVERRSIRRHGELTTCTSTPTNPHHRLLVHQLMCRKGDEATDAEGGSSERSISRPWLRILVLVSCWGFWYFLGGDFLTSSCSSFSAEDPSVGGRGEGPMSR